MSEIVFKFFPLDPNRKLNADEITGIKAYLRDENGPSIVSDSIAIHDYDGIQFIDCGSNFKYVRCPKCGKEIDRAKWQNTMDADYSKTGGFKLIKTIVCPCSFTSRLHGLNYHSACGFASMCLSVQVVSHFWTGWLRHYPWIGTVEARY